MSSYREMVLELLEVAESVSMFESDYKRIEEIRDALDNEAPSATGEFEVRRWHGGGTGCYGNESLYRQDVEENFGHGSGISPGYLLGETLPNGTVVRVTVEVVERGEGFGDPHPAHGRSYSHPAGFEHAPECERKA